MQVPDLTGLSGDGFATLENQCREGLDGARGFIDMWEKNAEAWRLYLAAVGEERLRRDLIRKVVQRVIDHSSEALPQVLAHGAGD